MALVSCLPTSIRGDPKEALTSLALVFTRVGSDSFGSSADRRLPAPVQRTLFPVNHLSMGSRVPLWIRGLKGGGFPIMRRYGGLASVSLHNPQLALDGSAHRATLGSRLVIVSLLAATFLRGRAGCEQWPALGCLGPARALPGLTRGATALRRRHRKRRTEPGAHQRVHLPGSAASAIRRTRIDWFSLHAAVRCAADDRQVLEQLSRYITRPALAKERVQTNAALAQPVIGKSSGTFHPDGVGAFSFFRCRRSPQGAFSERPVRSQ